MEFSILGTVCASASVGVHPMPDAASLSRDIMVSFGKREVGNRGRVPPGFPQVETSVSGWRKVTIDGRLIE